jgi:hypothetical protein
MIDFLVFSVKRYARFCSYIAAFLAGFSFGLSSTLFWCGLAASIVLGSLSAYESRPHSERPAGRVRTDARPCAGADSVSEISHE